MGFKRWFDSRESVEAAPPLTEEEAALLAKLAAKVIQWKMTVPAILFLESVKPLNYLGAQAMVFFEPFATTIFNGREYDTFRVMIERRENVERLLQKIEELDSLALQSEKEARRQRRAGRGGRSWWRPFSGGSG
ncbi:MAG: hypothetical protein HY304_07605 [candidate division Zixibacteria bacterium]|nr:hypothetical protein [candidate division Zixibacteria bacterium]